MEDGRLEIFSYIEVALLKIILSVYLICLGRIEFLNIKCININVPFFSTKGFMVLKKVG